MDHWNLHLFRGRGDGTFQVPSTLPFVTDGPLAAGDLNSDGAPDLIGFEANAVLVSLLGNGDGTFLLASEEPLDRWVSQVELADLNQDGRLDLVVGPACGNGAAIWNGNGDGTFIGTGISLPVGQGPHGLAVADLNGDTLPELIVTNSDDYTLSILYNDTDRPFATTSTYVAGINPRGVVAGDFDRNGKLELAIANYEGFGNFNVLFGVPNANCH